MKCPFCDNEMTEGVVQGGRGFFFTTEPHSIWMWPNTAKGEIMLSTDNWNVPTCTACHCPKCKKVILNYGEKPE